MKKIIDYSNDKIFSRLLKNKSSKNYWDYISELRKRKTKDIFNKAIELTTSEKSKEKIIGINIIAQFGHPRLHQKEIIKTLFRLLKKETNKNVLSTILYAIGHNNENLTVKQIKILCSFHNHKSANVRHSLTTSLSTLLHTEAIQTLIELSKDKDSNVRDRATFSLGTQIELDNESIREALWNRISDEHKGTRNEAIFGLAKRKDKRIKEILKIELSNIDEFGSSILESIEEFNDKEFINFLEKQIAKNKKTKRVNEEWLKSTLQKLKETD